MPHNTTLSSSPSSFLGRLSARSSFISSKDVKVVVQLLNDADSISNEFKRSQPAQAILDYVCELRNIREKDYLGLRYQDHNKHRYWVDLSRPIAHIAKQFKSDSLALRLRFRYYPAEPSHLRESVSRYQLFMQLQRDLLHGRLYCLQSQAAELAALILQAQLGDYNEAVHTGNYVSQYKLLLKQSPLLEERIAAIHKSLRGKATPVAELEFLEKASRLDTYGFDPYTVKDPKDASHAVYLGVSHKGILIFHASQKVHHIPWSYLSKVDYIGKDLYIYPTESYVPPVNNGFINPKPDTNQTKDRKSRLVLKYHCPSSMFAKHLWNHILSQQAFFNEQSALMIKPKFSKPRIPLLTRGSTFRFPSRRVLREIENTDIPVESEHVANGAAFVRFELPRQEPRGDQPWLNKYHTMPNVRTNHNNNERSTANQNPVEELIVKNTATQSDAERTFIVSQSIPSTSTETNETSNSAKNELKPQISSEMHNGNVTSFTVRLVKFERSPAASPEPEGSHETKAIHKEPTVSLSANASSIADRKIHFPLRNGSLRSANDRSIRSFTWCTNVFFSTFLFMLILVVFSIALFERSGDTDWVRSTKWLSHVQHTYYEPAREVVWKEYQKYFRR
ncbi:FERM N-terminal domain [Parelaphostrongylus tenuis]|uniref:FERM N-terminal domain n=1 Tax=Parelaphostrongylus tenuis TaxID=148309 RepID=A0AAD5MSC5_PARTN|nr:FERM N-terminal domain [Parelaphostrongylus tenuis]